MEGSASQTSDDSPKSASPEELILDNPACHISVRENMGKKSDARSENEKVCARMRDLSNNINQSIHACVVPQLHDGAPLEAYPLGLSR